MAKAPTAAKENVAIELPKLDVQMMEITLIGDSPLIVHAWSSKAKKEMLDKQMKKAKGAKEAKDPRADFKDSLYRLPGGYGFPSIAFKAAAITAVTSVSGVTKVAARQVFHVVGESVDIDGAFDGVKMRADLIRIEGADPRMREDMVRVGMGAADLRYRGEFWPWHAKVLVRFNVNVLSPAQILNLFNIAGFAVGVGEHRPERNGDNGMFHVATEAEQEALENSAAKRRAAKRRAAK